MAYEWELPPEGGGGGVDPSDPSPYPDFELEIISVHQIAAELQALLGDQFTLYVNNNTGKLIDIKKNEKIESRFLDFTKTIAGVMTTSTGEVVALKDLFSTSFGFEINFYCPTSKNITPELNALILAQNGALNEIGNAKYLLTFNVPMVTGLTEVVNGTYYQVVRVSGNVAITSASLFGNELKVTLDDEIDLSKVTISSSIDMIPQLTPPEGTEDTYVPTINYQLIRNIANFTIHLRKDSFLSKELFRLMIDPDLLTDKYFKLTLNFNGNQNSWNCLITGISTVFTIGGYVIMNLGFERTQVIT